MSKPEIDRAEPREPPMPVPQSMTAIAITSPGGPAVLKPVSLPVPQPGEGELLIEVAAAGINRPDVMQREGRYPPPPGAPATPGLEIAGRVAALGRNTRRFRTGAEVCALVPGGGYAQYCIAAEANALPVPKGLSLIEAAALPETFFTVWTNVFERGRLVAGERFLVHGGTSGIGTTAIMLAKAFGARVFTTAGSDEKCRFAERLGADRAVNYRSEDFVAVLKAASDGRGIDLILDMVGGDYIAKNLELAARDGRIVSISFLNGSQANVNFLPILTKRLWLTGSTLRPRSVAEKASIAEALERQVWPLIERGEVKPVIDSDYPLAKAADAHARMDSGQLIGKVVLIP